MWAPRNKRVTFFVIPTLKHYSDIVSDILEVYMAHLFWHSILSGILSGKYAASLSDILSGIYSDILSGIYSAIVSDILSSISSGILCGRGPAGVTLSSSACSWGPAGPAEEKEEASWHKIYPLVN